MMRRRHSFQPSMLPSISLSPPAHSPLSPTPSLLSPDYTPASLFDMHNRERSKSPAPTINMRCKSPVPMGRCKSPAPIGRCKSPAPLALVEEEHDVYKQKLADERHTAFKQRLQKLEDRGHEPKEIMPAPVVLILSDKFTAFGGHTSSTAYVAANLLGSSGCNVYCTSTIPDGYYDTLPEEKRGENIHLIRACVSHDRENDGLLQPKMEWISQDFKKHFPGILRPMEEASHIIGIVPTTAETAFKVAALWWQEHKIRVKVALFLSTKISDPEMCENVKKWAYKADNIFSIGPKLKRYYDEIFAERKDIDNHKHKLFVYHPKALEMEDRPPGPFEIVSFLRLGPTTEDNSEVKKDFKLAAKAFSNACGMSDTIPIVHPQWFVFTNHENLDEKALAKENYGFEKKIPPQLRDEMVDHLFACSLVLAPETESNGFNFEAWEAIGAGYPTLVTATSGLGQLMRHEEVMNLYSSRSVAYVAGHSEILRDFIQQHFVKRQELTAENSKLLGMELRQNEFLSRMELQFVETFTKGTILDEELKTLMSRRQSTSELRSVNKLVKLCPKHQKELGLFCRKCKEPICITCSDDEKHEKHKSEITPLSGFFSFFYRYTEMKTEKQKTISNLTSSAVGDTTKDLRNQLSDCDTVRATIGVYKHALDNAVGHVAEKEKSNVVRLNEIRKHIEHITSEIEETIRNMTESEKNKLVRFSVHVEDVLKEIMDIKDSGTTILERQSDQTKIHSALDFIDGFEDKMGDVLKKLKVLRSWKVTSLASGAGDEEIKTQVQKLVGSLSFTEKELPLPKLHETQMKVVNDVEALIDKPPEIVIGDDSTSSPPATSSPPHPSLNGIDEDGEDCLDGQKPKEKKKKKEKKAKKEKEKSAIAEDVFNEEEDEELKRFKKSKSRSNRRMSYML